MNGYGWVCDECGQTEVLASSSFPHRDPFQSEPPANWYVLRKASAAAGIAADRWEFCSVECIHAQTAPPMRCEHCGESHLIADCPELGPYDEGEL